MAQPAARRVLIGSGLSTDSDAVALQLPHPNTGTAAAFLQLEDGQLLELNWHKSAYTSWFVGDCVIEGAPHALALCRLAETGGCFSQTAACMLRRPSTCCLSCSLVWSGIGNRRASCALAVRSCCGADSGGGFAQTAACTPRRPWTCFSSCSPFWSGIGKRRASGALATTRAVSRHTDAASVHADGHARGPLLQPRAPAGGRGISRAGEACGTGRASAGVGVRGAALGS